MGQDENILSFIEVLDFLLDVRVDLLLVASTVPVVGTLPCEVPLLVTFVALDVFFPGVVYLGLGKHRVYFGHSSCLLPVLIPSGRWLVHAEDVGNNLGTFSCLTRKLISVSIVTYVTHK
jgi:hypothetical protein